VDSHWMVDASSSPHNQSAAALTMDFACQASPRTAEVMCQTELCAQPPALDHFRDGGHSRDGYRRSIRFYEDSLRGDDGSHDDCYVGNHSQGSCGGGDYPHDNQSRADDRRCAAGGNHDLTHLGRHSVVRVPERSDSSTVYEEGHPVEAAAAAAGAAAAADVVPSIAGAQGRLRGGGSGPAPSTGAQAATATTAADSRSAEAAVAAHWPADASSSSHIQEIPSAAVWSQGNTLPPRTHEVDNSTASAGRQGDLCTGPRFSHKQAVGDGEAPTNERPPSDPPTNERPPSDPPTNERPPSQTPRVFDAGEGARVDQSMESLADLERLIEQQHASLVEKVLASTPVYMLKTIDPGPYTLHLIPNTVYPIPYTLYPTPHYTLYPTPYTLHHIPCILYPTPYIPHLKSDTSHSSP